MFQLITTSDYKWVANRETLTVYPPAGLGVSVTDCKRLMQGQMERSPSEGQYLGTRCDFRIPYQLYGGTIVPGTILTDSQAIAYTVLSVDPPGSYLGTWNASCIALMVTGHTIAWGQPSNATDEYASPLITETTLQPVPAAIQEIACEEVLFQGIITGFRRTYSIWIVGDVTLSLGSIGTDETGKQYTITNVFTRNRLDELLRVEAVVQP